MGFALNDPGWWPYIWGPYFGAELYNEKTDTVDVRQPSLVKAYDFVNNSGKRWGPNILAMLKAGSNGSKQGALFSGKTAFEFNGSWQASY